MSSDFVPLRDARLLIKFGKSSGLISRDRRHLELYHASMKLQFKPSVMKVLITFNEEIINIPSGSLELNMSYRDVYTVEDSISNLTSASQPRYKYWGLGRYLKCPGITALSRAQLSRLSQFTQLVVADDLSSLFINRSLSVHSAVCNMVLA
jgi:hypothetical protein